MRPPETLVDGLDHPEGVAWDPAAQVLYDGGEPGQAYRVDGVARTFAEVGRAPGFVLGLTVDADGRTLRIVQPYDPTVSRVDLETGEVEHVARLDGTEPDGVALTADGGLLVSCYRTYRSGRRHLTLLDRALRGAPLHRPRRCAADAR